MNYKLLHDILINVNYISLASSLCFCFSALTGVAITQEPKKLRFALSLVFLVIGILTAIAVGFLPYLLPEYQAYLDTIDVVKPCFHCR